MSQPQQTLNPWLVSYISQHYKTQTRYEIDRYLLEAGYDPKEIEKVWHSLLFQADRVKWKSKKWRKWLSPIKSEFNLAKIEIKGVSLNGITWREIIAVIGSFGFLWLGPKFYGYWPFIFISSIIWLILALMGITIALILWFWSKSKKGAGLTRKLLLRGTAIIVGLIGLVFLTGAVLESGYEEIEIASASANENTYHLVYSSGCIDTCAYYLTLYYCHSSSLLCSSIDSFDVNEIDKKGISVRAYPKEFTLLFDATTNRLNLFYSNIVIYSFKSS